MTYRGYIDHFLFYNESNGYGVFELYTEKEDIICVGSFPGLTQGASVVVEGEPVVHPVYGEQLSVTHIEESKPTSAFEIQRYLSCGAVKGIGETLAARIVKIFGDDTLRIMEEEPERLAEVKGISERMAMEIGSQIESTLDLRETLMFLQRFNISNAMSMKLYKRYGPEVKRIITENPYRLADEVDGIGFGKADELALSQGIKIDSEIRIKCGIRYILREASMEGHTCLPMELLLERGAAILGVKAGDIESQLPNMVMESKLNIRREGDESLCFLNYIYQEETACAVMLKELNITLGDRDREKRQQELQEILQEWDCQLDELQQKAVAAAWENSIFILTGGPGTGKTTTLNAIIKYFYQKGMDILLAAPTGRAAKRMTEATGYEAVTVHRLLELKGTGDEDGGPGFGRNEENPLEADVVIIDECSMLDIHLFYHMLRAITRGTRLILVGDVNQLPSVGPGQVLKDLLQSTHFKSVQLEHIYRQQQGSDIVTNAHRINKGMDIRLDTNSKDFLFLERNDVDVIYKHMVYFISEKLPVYVEADIFQIQVLTPTRKGPLGAPALNKVLQDKMNPPSPHKNEYLHKDIVFRKGDKVMQNKNNYNLEWEVQGYNNIKIDGGVGIFNGDMGIIRDIDTAARRLVVEFDEKKKVIYSFENLDELELAYAITIHKSQGSEYPAVVMPLLTGPPQLMNRSLLYTGVTRASRCVMILGSSETVKRMIHNENEKRRYTGLALRIREVERN